MESKELEALERLYKCYDDDYTLGYRQHDYKLLHQALEEKQDLEKFTRLVIEKGISIDHLKYEPYLTDYNWWANKYLGGEEYELTEDEFNFAKEMIKKYED